MNVERITSSRMEFAVSHVENDTSSFLYNLPSLCQSVLLLVAVVVRVTPASVTNAKKDED